MFGATIQTGVMAGLVPAIHVARSPCDEAIHLSSCAGLTRASIDFRESLSKEDGLPGQARQ
jgi:hypothetical protein